ncbi:MAG: hypothetical protein LBI01_02820 [Elusimicrobium sp.]|jgi:hypothetical protein|nr:hypothetical protein [Elusimicrobium sp.]
MKKTISIILIFFMLSQPLTGLAQSVYGVSILDESDYNMLAQDTDNPPAQPEKISNNELMQYSEQFWRDAVRAVDGDNPLDKDVPPPITSLRPSFSLPLYGTSISLTGRQTFGIKGEAKNYKNENKNTVSSKSFSTFLFEQQMQLKMQGKIVDRIFVDIDYDNQNADKQDISIAYRGKAGEFVQSAEFGDVQLTLPKTEFISFSKQLFGAKMHLQSGNANLRLIGSKTKGTGKSKQFRGSNVFETVTIQDKNYIRRMYYNVKGMTDAPSPFFNYQIATNSELVYIDDGTSSSQYRFENLSYSYLDDPGAVYPARKFRLLQRGIDYTVDYVNFQIIFKKSLAVTDMVVIDYVNSAGQRLLNEGQAGTYKVLKSENDTPVSPAPGALGPEIKTIYDIGRRQITRDDGNGNFTLVLQDANGKNISAQETQLYPRDINVDFEKGIFQLKNRLADASLYNNTPLSTRNLSFRVELNSKVKSYFVEPNMVVQSETVKVNGVTLKRNDDYYIDYSSGFLTFYKEGLITQEAVIDVSYETSGGDNSDVSLLGARFDYDFTKDVGVGATVLQQGGSVPNRAPDINALDQNLTVYEADAKAKNINVTKDFQVSASGEAAKSVKDKNLFGYALIDNMDDAKQFVGGSMVFKDWLIASNPGGVNSYWGAVRWDTQEIKSLEINPNSASTTDDKQSVLLINYDFTKSDEVSIVYPMSSNGADLSNKTIFELTAQGNAQGPDVNFRFGQINEISDTSSGDNTITCSKFYPDYVPKTEDKYCRGTVSPEEDLGWIFVDPDGTQHRYDPFSQNVYNRETQPNGRADTQDLDGNGRLDPEDLSQGGSFGYDVNPANHYTITGMTGGYTLDNTNWQTFTTPLNITNKDAWTTVKQLRISLRHRPGTPNQGTIRIAHVGLSGNAWTPDRQTSEITAINKTDNTDYVPIFDDNTGDGYSVFTYLYGSLDQLRSESRNKNIFEQALAFYYDTLNYAQQYANRTFSSMDMTTHKELRFLLFVKNPDAQSDFFVRVGTDKNYQQISVNLGGLPANRWKLVRLKLESKTGSGIPNTLTPITPGVQVTEVLAPASPSPVNFQKISLITAGVQRAAGAAGIPTGEVWFNELHMADSVTAEGMAYRGDLKMQLKGWGDAGGTYRNMDDKFETPVTVATNQKNETQDYYVNLTKINHLPVKATYSQSTVETMSLLDSVNTNTISALDQGVVERKNGGVKAEYNKPAMPKISVEYSFDRANYDLAQRDDARDTYSANISQSLPAGSFVHDYSAGYTKSDNTIDYSAAVNNAPLNALLNTDEHTNRVNGRVSFEPWKGSSITPTYNLTTVKEDRSGGMSSPISYPKGVQQQAGITGNFRITRWLIPALSYNVNTTETNNLTATTLTANGASRTFDVGEIKDINRSADGGVSLNFNMRDIFPENKLLANLVVSNSYKLQDADSYVNVEEGFDSRTNFWLRDGLNVKNSFAYRRNMTLRDTLNSSLKWNPFKEYSFAGVAAPLKTLSVINNFTQAMQSMEETGTRTRSVSKTLPDAVVTVSDLEKIYGGTYFLTAASLKLRMTEIENETFNTSMKRDNNYGAELRFMLIKVFDTLLSYSHTDGSNFDYASREYFEKTFYNEYVAQTSFYIKHFRLTPKFNYIESMKTERMGIVTEQYQDFIPSLNIRLDYSMPGGIWLPFVNRNYATTNRIIWNTNLSYQKRRSPFVVLNNKNYYSLDTSLDYEFSKNLRLTLNGGVQVLDHLFVASESYLGYNFGTMLTLQF